MKRSNVAIRIAALGFTLAVVHACCYRDKRPLPEIVVTGGPPGCRLWTPPAVVLNTLVEALKQSKELKDLPYDGIAINPISFSPRILQLHLIRDAERDTLGADGCPTTSSQASREWDDLTVRGICRVRSGRIYCSADAVEGALKGDVSHRGNGVSPLLLYVFAHELGHIAAQDPGTSAHSFLQISRSPAMSSSAGCPRPAWSIKSRWREKNSPMHSRLTQ